MITNKGLSIGYRRRCFAIKFHTWPLELNLTLTILSLQFKLPAHLVDEGTIYARSLLAGELEYELIWNISKSTATNRWLAVSPSCRLDRYNNNLKKIQIGKQILMARRWRSKQENKTKKYIFKQICPIRGDEWSLRAFASRRALRFFCEHEQR